MGRDVKWVDEALYELWHQGVSVVLWFLICDQPPLPSCSTTCQSGLYLLDGAPKRSQRAFAFPFLVVKRRGGAELWWTRTPAAGMLLVQRKVRVKGNARERLLRACPHRCGIGAGSTHPVAGGFARQCV